MQSSEIDADERAQRAAMRQRYQLERSSLGDRSRSTSVLTERKRDESQNQLNAAEIYQQCLLLHTQKKISAKNAFSLDLIDVLPELKDVDPQLMNFAYAGKVINVAATIYSCRVDNVCRETHELYNEALRYENRSDAGAADAAELTDEPTICNDQNEEQKKPKRKRQKKAATDIDLLDLDCQVEKDLSKITMTQEEFEEVMDPTYAAAKKFNEECNLEATLLQAFNVVNDSGQTQTTLLPDKPFEWPSNMPELLTKRVDKVVNKLQKFNDIGSTLSYKYGYADANEAPSLQELAKDLLNPVSDASKTMDELGMREEMELDAELVPIDEPVFVAAAQMDDDESEDDEITGKIKMLDVKTACASLSKTQLQYSYIIPSNIPAFNGATVWQEPMSKFLNIKKTRTAVKRKKSESQSLSLCTVSSAAFQKNSKVGNRCTYFNLAELDDMNLKKREVMGVPYHKQSLYKIYAKRASIPNLSIEPIHSQQEEAESSADEQPICEDHFVLADDSFVGSQERDPIPESQHYQESLNSEFGDADISADELYNIVLSAPVASQQQIPVQTKVKRIDIGRTKKVIRRTLEKENVQTSANVDDENNGQASGSCDFTKIYRALLSQPKLRPDMTVQSAFVCLLHMCNEQKLDLVPQDDGDFAIVKAKQSG